ncbi:hypothetical protein GUITHDRAFT_117147 [Guillardia theta CCMP2712]|uniref:Uncharacterized protein n=1 Tax=Guillardia theta (strain CCMP2712) TaxID=905079 RepID=L1IKQ9_GUITC|nr:hypothetical protein GUITHDRAFT_117147 [Guillardia theta CCMP2712]EKX36717.1 hypothetical protein GUITHDRAFT_117147 [Guillardia theta CCMP2712]|eukprot:XP_005823697.1 hypothetical protein GUITHDRAFT_117147 [Guillardia theta CCMP2712]
MSKYIESEPEEDDEDDCHDSENEEDRAFINDDAEDDNDMSVYREHQSDCDEDSTVELRKITSRMIRGHQPMEDDWISDEEDEPDGYIYDFGIKNQKSTKQREDLLRQAVKEDERALFVKSTKETTHSFQRPVIERVSKPLPAKPTETELKPRQFSFIQDLEESERKKRLKDNAASLAKTLSKEREKVHRRLTAPPRKAVVKKPLVAEKGDKSIKEFFTKI